MLRSDYESNANLKQQRYDRFMQKQSQISTAKLKRRIGQTIQVLIDEVDEEGAIGRSFADASEIDGLVYLNGDVELKPGDLITATIEHSDEYDLWAARVAVNDMSA
tara:strand:+ start:22671 stop:22988 length:318 start_codon:yes stop_codon:yes gene_type:complete